MRIISKYQKLNKHALHAKLKTASHRFALMVDNYSPDDTEAENGLLMVTGKVFVPGYTDATVTIVYPKRKRSTDQSFYYITPTESTEDMSLAYSDDTFYPRFSECEQAVKDLPEVTVSQYFYDKGIIPDDPSTFTALTGIPLESSLVEDINEITGEDTNYYTIGADEGHRQIDRFIKNNTDYQDGDQIIPYLDITDKFFNNGTPTPRMLTVEDLEVVKNNILVSPTDFYNSLTIILRQPSEHPELNTEDIYNDTDWCITITSTFISEITNVRLTYSYSESFFTYASAHIGGYVYSLALSYMYSLYSSLDEWSNLVINGVLQLGSKNLLQPDLYNEYLEVCANGNPWTYKNSEFTIKTRDLEGFTPVGGLGNGVFHFVLSSNRVIEESLSHFSNPTFLNENPNDNQLYLSDLPNDKWSGYSSRSRTSQYSTVYFASNKHGREIVFLHLPDTLLSGCLDTAPSWTTLNYLKTQGQQLMNCLQETIMSLNNNDDDTESGEIEDITNDLMSRLIDKGWTQQTSNTIISPQMGNNTEWVKLQFTCINDTWSLSGIIVPCEATGGEVPLPLSDTQLNEGVTSEDIQFSLEKATETDDLWLDSFVKANSNATWIIDRGGNSDPGERLNAIIAAEFINSDIRDLSNVTPTLEEKPNSSATMVALGDLTTSTNAVEWVERVLQTFNLPHSLDLPSNYELPYNNISISNNEYEVTFRLVPERGASTIPLQIMLVDEIAAEYIAQMTEGINPLRPGPKVNYTLWTDLFYNTPYADFSTILPGVGPYLTLLYVFNQPLLDDPQIINNIQRRLNREAVIKEVGQTPQEDNDNQEDKSWLAQVAECMNQSQIFEQTTEDAWSRTTEPIVINGTDYSQQVAGGITIHADSKREEIKVKPFVNIKPDANNSSQYANSLIPESLADVITRNAPSWVPSEKVDTLIGHDVLNGITTAEQLTALEENTNDVLPWLSNSSAQQVKDLQKAAGWVQYCDKILNNEEIPSLDFISQGLHGNILNLLRKNNITGTTGINDFLHSLGAVPVEKTRDRMDLTEIGSNFYPFAYDIARYYALPVEVNNFGTLYCLLVFTKQNGKPVCQLQDDCLCLDQGAEYKYRFWHAIYEPGAHYTTLGETFNNLVTGAGLPDYNLLHFLQEQLSNGLQATDAALQALEKNKNYVDYILR